MVGIRRRIGPALALTLTGALVFVVASAYVVSREQPRWLAAAIGALAFPLGPVAWHVVAERRRRTRIAVTSSPKTTLTASDRLWLRVAAAAIAVIGPMIALGGFDVARAAWHHATWWVPRATSTALPADVAPLLHRVPSDAELAIIVRSHCVFAQPNGNAVAAWGNGQAAVVAEPSLAGNDLDTEIGSLLDERRYYPFLPFDALDAVTLDDVVAFASSGWRTRVASGGDGPSEDLRSVLARAPSDAKIVVAFVPRTVTGVPVRSGVGWMRADPSRPRLIAEARVEAVDDAAATKLADNARAALASIDRLPPACREKLRAVTSAVTIERDGAIVTARADVSALDLAGLLALDRQTCADPSRAAACNEVADHLAQVSTATMDPSSRRRVLAACATWADSALDCLRAAQNDDEISRCESQVVR